MCEKISIAKTLVSGSALKSGPVVCSVLERQVYYCQAGGSITSVREPPLFGLAPASEGAKQSKFLEIKLFLTSLKERQHHNAWNFGHSRRCAFFAICRSSSKQHRHCLFRVEEFPSQPKRTTKQ